jgi:CBS domain-containing protein
MIMNNEGVTSLAVVDNQYNVVGNISNVDVKVLAQLNALFLEIVLTVAAPHKVKLSAFTRKHMHTLRFRHSFNARHE